MLIWDGGLATELERHLGYVLDDPLWSAKVLVENPELVEKVHYEYFLSGADAAVTCSYQACFENLSTRQDCTKSPAEILRQSASLAASARDRAWPILKPLVVASCGCYGAYLADASEYTGIYNSGNSGDNNKIVTKTLLKEWHYKRWIVFEECDDVDWIAFETIPCLVEVEAIFELLCENTCQKPVYISLACKDGSRLNSSESVSHLQGLFEKYDCQQTLLVGIGINCTAPEHIESLLLNIPFPSWLQYRIVYPNSGEKFDADKKTWYGDGLKLQKDFVELSKKWRNAGANVIGGCCRTTPQHIRALKAAHTSQE